MDIVHLFCCAHALAPSVRAHALSCMHVCVVWIRHTRAPCPDTVYVCTYGTCMGCACVLPWPVTRKLLLRGAFLWSSEGKNRTGTACEQICKLHLLTSLVPSVQLPCSGCTYAPIRIRILHVRTWEKNGLDPSRVIVQTTAATRGSRTKRSRPLLRRTESVQPSWTCQSWVLRFH